MARDIRLFYLFRLLSTSYLFVPIALAFSRSRGLGETEFWTLAAIYSAVVVLTEVPTGMLSDRVGRRVTMMAGAVCMVAACAMFYFAHSFPAFAVGQALAALSMTLCSGADSAYLFDLLHDHGRGDEYPQREGTASAWHQAGNTLAFAAGGVLAEVDLSLPYLAAAGVSTVAFFVALSMRKDRLPDAPVPLTPREAVGHMRASFAMVWRKKTLAWAVGYSAIVFVMVRVTENAYQSYLFNGGFRAVHAGVIFAVVYLVAAFVAHHADWLRRRLAEPVLLWGLLGTLVVTFLILGQIAGSFVLGVFAMQAVANGLYSPLVKPLLQRNIDDSKRRATVLSVESMIRRALFSLFIPLTGWLVGTYSVSIGFTVCGAFGLLGLLVLMMTRRPAAPGETTAAAIGPERRLSGAAAPAPAPAPLAAPARVAIEPERDLT
jgi:MFS family permease